MQRYVTKQSQVLTVCRLPIERFLAQGTIALSDCLGTVMVLVLGISKIGEHWWSEIGNLICLRHLFRKTAVAKLK